MIGNDIVDLKLASRQSNWQRKGWLQKVFVPQEIEDILCSDNPDLLVWEFWSRKEATYKAHQRRFGCEPQYIPQKIRCDLKNKVIVNGHSYQTITKRTEYFVYSVATVSNIEYRSEIHHSSYNSRTLIEKIIRQKLGKSLMVSFEKDANRIPVLKTNRRLSEIPFSITNHGQYAAYAIAI